MQRDHVESLITRRDSRAFRLESGSAVSGKTAHLVNLCRHGNGSNTSLKANRPVPDLLNDRIRPFGRDNTGSTGSGKGSDLLRQTPVSPDQHTVALSEPGSFSPDHIMIGKRLAAAKSRTTAGSGINPAGTIRLDRGTIKVRAVSAVRPLRQVRTRTRMPGAGRERLAARNTHVLSLFGLKLGDTGQLVLKLPLNIKVSFGLGDKRLRTNTLFVIQVFPALRPGSIQNRLKVSLSRGNAAGNLSHLAFRGRTHLTNLHCLRVLSGH